MKTKLQLLLYAKKLAEALGVAHKYEWKLAYWSNKELHQLIYGLEKRVRG